MFDLEERQNYWQLACHIMDESFNTIKDNWKSFFFYFIGYYFLSSLLGVVIAIGIIIIATLMATSVIDQSGLGLFVLISILVGIFMTLSHSLLEGARFGIGWLQDQRSKGERVMASKALGRSLKILPKITYLTLLLDLPLLLLCAGVVVFILSPMGQTSIEGLGYWIDAIIDMPFYFALFLFGCLLFILLGFLAHEVYRTYTSYALYAATLGPLSVIEAIKWAFKFSNQYFKMLFTARVAISLAMSMLSFAMTWLLMAITLVLSFATMGLWPILSMAISQPIGLLQTVVTLVAMLFTSGCGFLSYLNYYKVYGNLSSGVIDDN